MDDVMWKCTAAFALGAAAHFVLSRQLQAPAASVSGSAFADTKLVAESARVPEPAVPLAAASAAEEQAEEAGGDSSESDDSDWEDGADGALVPHKMVLCVRTDLKMGKGKIAAQCCHATLGAYKRAVKRAPGAVRAWEMLGQAKVCLKVDSEEEMLTLAATAAEIGLVNYVVVDAGRTQIAPDSKTVLSIGPAPIEAVNAVTGHLKLM